MINGASNHSFDRNIEGVNNASRTWRNFDNIIYAGTYDSASDRNKIRVIEKEGIKFALLSYTHTINEYNENPYTLLQRTPYAVPLLTDRQAIESDIKKAKELADVVIVSAHWGKENDATITNVQREYAQYFADLGVDLVIGTHPHLIQPVEWVAGVDGNKTLVAYSLGNFLSTMETKETQLEGMLSLDFVKKNKKIKIENVAFTPLVNHFGDNTIEVYRLSKYPKKKLANHFVLKDHPNAIKEFQAKTKEIIGNEIKIKE